MTKPCNLLPHVFLLLLINSLICILSYLFTGHRSTIMLCALIHCHSRPSCYLKMHLQC